MVGSFELDQGTVVKIMVKVDGLRAYVNSHGCVKMSGSVSIIKWKPQSGRLKNT